MIEMIVIIYLLFLRQEIGSFLSFFGHLFFFAALFFLLCWAAAFVVGPAKGWRRTCLWYFCTGGLPRPFRKHFADHLVEEATMSIVNAYELNN
jgi:cellulose synthase/poly-beta-1,6-N-acetylglucosamine synthase-like glycosyltransferase